MNSPVPLNFVITNFYCTIGKEIEKLLRVVRLYKSITQSGKVITTKQVMYCPQKDLTGM